ncbi:GAF domain-containing protein [Haloarcula marina]|uniref:GAF domain-containing protein n=1 Tax=Haloarcula marina TaxID=2961574 RepID=UPI0020B8AD64|nr:GAF domain-containing protein [Halomicroarcula marina]
MTRTVLCIDGPDRIDEVSDTIDADADLTAVQATSVEEARQLLASEPVVAVVTAAELPDGDGMDIVTAIRDSEVSQTPCVLYTDLPPSEIDTTAVEESIVEYLDRSLPDAGERLQFVTNDVIEHSTQVSFMAPEDEGERLDALAEYDVENLPVEESFERMTDLIASHFDAGVAFIGLIERDEESFLACHGADLDSLTREETICTHSMLQEDVMVVEDITTDKRFSENEYLQHLGIRSYAGANMTTHEGHVIGQVCLIDFEPRSYSPEEQAELESFADLAMETLDLRQALRDARTATPQVPEADAPTTEVEQ